MKSILEQHLNCEVGMNIEKPLYVESVRIVAVHDDYFTVQRDSTGNRYHLPFLNVVKIIENPDGVVVGGIFRHKKTYPLVVKIGHIVDYMPT